jgi:hypothetical protein
MWDVFLEELHQRAQELLNDATDLDKAIQGSTKPTRTTAEILQRACGALTRIKAILDSKSGPLDRLVAKVGGVIVGATAEKVWDDFVKEHEDLLRTFGVSEGLLKQLRKDLEEDISPDERLAPETVDARYIKDRISDIQQLICSLAQEAKEHTLTPELIGQCVKGLIGASMIVVDITGALTVPDVTGIVLFKAVKSTFAGGRMLQKAVGKARDWFTSLKGRKALKKSSGRPPRIKKDDSQ